jgi:hypothetical protein
MTVIVWPNGLCRHGACALLRFLNELQRCLRHLLLVVCEVVPLSHFSFFRRFGFVVGIPNVQFAVSEGDYNVMVHRLVGSFFGRSLNYCGRRFSPRCVLMLADQLLSRLNTCTPKLYSRHQADNFF